MDYGVVKGNGCRRWRHEPAESGSELVACSGDRRRADSRKRCCRELTRAPPPQRPKFAGPEPKGAEEGFGITSCLLPVVGKHPWSFTLTVAENEAAAVDDFCWPAPVPEPEPAWAHVPTQRGWDRGTCVDTYDNNSGDRDTGRHGDTSQDRQSRRAVATAAAALAAAAGTPE